MGELGQAEIKVKLDSVEADAELDRLEARVDRVVAKLGAFQAEDDARVLDLVKRGIRVGWNEQQKGGMGMVMLSQNIDSMARRIIDKTRKDAAGAEPRTYNNHEADVLCCVPLTLAESVQALHDALLSYPREFEKGRQALIHKASTVHARDPFIGHETASMPREGEVWRDKIRTLRGKPCWTLILATWQRTNSVGGDPQWWVEHTTPGGNYQGDLEKFLNDYEPVTGPSV